MLRRIGLLVCRLYGDDVPEYSPVEKWALRASKLATPDDIIIAAVIQSFAKNYDDWNKSGTLSNGRVEGHTKPSSDKLCFVNKKTSVKVEIEHHYQKGKARDNDNMAPWYWHPKASVKINTVSMTDPAASTAIIEAWSRLEKVRSEAEAAARKAKADMERNEAAWNLAEKLLGMKRNEFGALVPVIEPESDCNCASSVGAIGCLGIVEE